MKKKPKKLHLSMETVKTLELSRAVAALNQDEMTDDCKETLVNIVCQTMP